MGVGLPQGFIPVSSRNNRRGYQLASTQQKNLLKKQRAMTLKITSESHLDHGLTMAHLRFILENFGDRAEFFIETVDMPDHLSDLECGLYGPIMGDEPVDESEVFYQERGGRGGDSRLIKKPSRPTRKLTIIAGPHFADECILYTAFGGPAAPKELFQENNDQTREFWSKHALSG